MLAGPEKGAENGGATIVGASASAAGVSCGATGVNAGCNYHASVNDSHVDYKGAKDGEGGGVVGRGIVHTLRKTE